MEKITLRDLLAATRGELIGAYRDLSAPVTGVQSDNRKVKPGDVFFAFVGEKTDGHKYVNAALEAGAAGAVVSRTPDEFLPGRFYVKVEDTILAAGDLARWYRRLFRIPVVGITGSVGKTTTKDMIASVLSEKYRVVRTEANFNNNIGLPRTIFRFDHTTELGVIEMGMNHPGEIDYLTRIAQPTAVTITNVGDAHIGLLGSRNNIFHAKTEIFQGLSDGGFAVMNGDDENLRRLRPENPRFDEEKTGTGIPFPELASRFRFAWVGESEDCDYRAVKIQDDLPDCVRFEALTPVGTMEITVPALGRHMIYPALTAAVMGVHFGLTKEQIGAGIAHYQATKMRMEVLRPGHGTIIYNDTYNANPQSMKAGLSALSQTAGVRHVAVVGDMFELGREEERCHREIGSFAAGLRIDTLVTVGRAAEYIADEAKKHGMKDVRAVKDKAEAEQILGELIAPDTAYFVKASHGMALEELAAFLEEKIKAM